MLVFCEECGEQYQIENSSKKAHFQCRKCFETLVIPNSEFGHENSLQAVPAIPGSSSKSAPSRSPIKVLVVDDSKVIRSAIRNILQNDHRVEMVGEAENGSDALKMIIDLRPDVVTMDINMPVMDGLTAVKNIMIKSPKPIIMISSLTEEGARETFDSLKYGAVDFIRKPNQIAKEDFEVQNNSIVEKIIMASQVRTDSIRLLRIPKYQEVIKPQGKIEYLFALGASEGGYSALLNIIPQLQPGLSAAFVAILYTEGQHVDSFVKYVNALSAIPVKRANDGDLLEAGNCYIASGKEYVTIDSKEENLHLQVHPSPFPERRGSINMLMFSAAEATFERTVGVVLSGSSDDGVEGIGEILRVGGTAIVQEPNNCLCKEASELTLNQYQVELILMAQNMASQINSILVPMYGET